MPKRVESFSLAQYSERLRGRDISNYQPVLQEMIQSHTILQAMYRYHPSVFYICNLMEGKFVYFAREAMRKLFQLDDAGIEKMERDGIPQMMSLIVPSDLPMVVEDLGHLSVAAMKGIPPNQIDKIRFTINYRARRGDGTVCSILNQFCYIPDLQDGMALFSVGSLTDISDVKGDTKITIKAEYFDELSHRNPIIQTLLPVDEGGLQFSARELEVIKLLGAGLKTEEIAARLFISPYTVRAHKRNIFDRAEVRKTAELISKLTKAGLI